MQSLLWQVMETAQEVANAPLLMNPLSFDQMKDQCEALILDKQQKLAALLSFKLDQDPLLEDKHMNEDPLNEACHDFYFPSLILISQESYVHRNIMYGQMLGIWEFRLFYCKCWVFGMLGFFLLGKERDLTKASETGYVGFCHTHEFDCTF